MTCGEVAWFQTEEVRPEIPKNAGIESLGSKWDQREKVRSADPPV
jgi:hypothetical protein